MRTAVVTGASRGIGSEFVARLIEDGWKVYAGYRSEKHRLELIDSKNLVCHRLDVTDNESISGFCEKITENVDLLIKTPEFRTVVGGILVRLMISGFYKY